MPQMLIQKRRGEESVMDSVREWKDLPKDILFRILQRLNAWVYYNLLRAVCPCWRSSLPLLESPLHRHPLHALTVPVFPKLRSCYHPRVDKVSEPVPPHDTIVQKIFFHLSPLEQEEEEEDGGDCIPYSWFIQVEEVGPNTGVLYNPQGTGKLRLRPISINLLAYRITELGRSFSLRWMDQICDHNRLFDTSRKAVRKLLCSSSDFDAERLVMALSNDYLRQLYFYHPAAENQGWNPDIKWDIDNHNFGDVISFNGRFYAVNRAGFLVVIDPSTWWKQPVPTVIYPDTSDDHVWDVSYMEADSMRLIVSQGSLYLVVCVLGRIGVEDYLMKVYVLRDESGDAKWVRVLPNQVFLIGAGGEASLAFPSSLIQCNIYDVFFGGYDDDWYLVEFADIYAHKVIYLRRFWEITLDHSPIQLFCSPPLIWDRYSSIGSGSDSE